MQRFANFQKIMKCVKVRSSHTESSAKILFFVLIAETEKDTQWFLQSISQMPKPANQSALLLGMVFATEQVAKRGQEYRDRVRCEALENIGYVVRTLDNKHSDAKLNKHCTANFSDTRRMMKSLNSKWSEQNFNHVILDYFFSPVGWARERWTDPLFTTTFPTLALSGRLAPGCKIWLPNLQCIDESLVDFHSNLAPYFNIRKEPNPKKNPLYLATEDVEKELLMCPDALTNETQVKPLNEYSNCPFYVLELKAEFAQHALDTLSPQIQRMAVQKKAPTSRGEKRKALQTPAVNSSSEESSSSESESPTKKVRKLATSVTVSPLKASTRTRTRI